MSENWNIITRTIMPLIDQKNIPTSGLGESGLGDIVASQFFSPKAFQLKRRFNANGHQPKVRYFGFLRRAGNHWWRYCLCHI
jgi:hypothetical protein